MEFGILEHWVYHSSDVHWLLQHGHRIQINIWIYQVQNAIERRAYELAACENDILYLFN